MATLSLVSSEPLCQFFFEMILLKTYFKLNDLRDSIEQDNRF